MDLQTAAKRYDEARHFWARELALTLTRGYSRTRRLLLQQLQASRVPMLATTLTAALPERSGNAHSHEQSTVRLLKECLDGGIVKRLGNRRAYRYALTELGELVLMYLPVNDEIDGPKNVVVNDEIDGPKNVVVNDEIDGPKKRGRPRKTPVIEALSV